jgi:hypothetical protein
MTLLFECAAFLPSPRSHAFRRRTQKITDSTVGDISLESLKELGMTSVQALVFKKEQQRHFAPPPTCAYTLRCLITLFFQMLLQVQIITRSFCTTPLLTAQPTKLFTMRATTRGRQLECSHLTRRSTSGDGECDNINISSVG